MVQAGPMMLRAIWYMAILLLFLQGCKEDPGSLEETVPEVVVPKVNTPNFDPDSAYSFVAQQVAFGPRVPGSIAHIACGDYLVNKLKGYGLQVLEQTGTVKVFNGREMPLRNIVAQHAPEKKERILLFAHWDTRPFADRSDEDKEQGAQKEM